MMYYINDIHGDNLKNEKGRALFEYVRDKYEGILLDTDKDVQAVSKDIREKEKELAKEYPKLKQDITIERFNIGLSSHIFNYFLNIKWIDKNSSTMFTICMRKVTGKMSFGCIERDF